MVCRDGEAIETLWIDMYGGFYLLFLSFTSTPYIELELVRCAFVRSIENLYKIKFFPIALKF